jgi:hypothetical protein
MRSGVIAFLYASMCPCKSLRASVRACKLMWVNMCVPALCERKSICACVQHAFFKRACMRARVQALTACYQAGVQSWMPETRSGFKPDCFREVKMWCKGSWVKTFFRARVPVGNLACKQGCEKASVQTNVGLSLSTCHMCESLGVNRCEFKRSCKRAWLRVWGFPCMRRYKHDSKNASLHSRISAIVLAELACKRLCV